MSVGDGGLVSTGQAGFPRLDPKILANVNKKELVLLIRRFLERGPKFPERLCETVQEMMLRLTGTDICLCPLCGKGRMIRVGVILASFDTSQGKPVELNSSYST